MASKIDTVRTSVITAVLAQTTATTTNFSYVSPDFRLTGTHAICVAGHGGYDGEDSNIRREVGVFQVTMLYLIPDPTLTNAEDIYLSGNALEDQGILMDANFWRDITDVYRADAPVLEFPKRDRPGNVIDYVVTCACSITPDAGA